MTTKIAVLVLYFGESLRWLGVWKKSALCNPAIDFHIISDCIDEPPASNLHIHHVTLAEINGQNLLAGEKLFVSNSYKICDFRPLFGEIFADIIEGYDYWGWGDLDILLGDLEHVLGSSFGKYDYIATGRDGASGPLAFLRNSPEVNSLWRQIPDVHAKLNDETHYALDERDFLDLLKREVQCDIEFRECLDDLPARWTNGEIVSVRSGRQYALHHFGGRLSHTRAGIVRDKDRLLSAMEHGRPIRIGASGDLFVEEPAGVLVDNTLSFLRSAKARLRKLA